MGKQKEITYNQLNQIKPVTDSQKLVFDTWKQGQNQFLFGCAGLNAHLKIISATSSIYVKSRNILP